MTALTNKELFAMKRTEVISEYTKLANSITETSGPYVKVEQASVKSEAIQKAITQLNRATGRDNSSLERLKTIVKEAIVMLEGLIEPGK